ncbi:hypothetical protein V1508DRAFT_458436 [Lipomyces doorenjongii]|uniref:uncharacterized protein n=1 Tax=Lipomyces doorenjongii TaxID=383834 RepID=UPI0034CF5879
MASIIPTVTTACTTVQTVIDNLCPPLPPASLRFTHVHYDDADPWAHIMAWISLAPQTLCIVYLTLIFSRREIETIILFVGQLASEVANHILKRILREERPKYGTMGDRDSLGFGLPSAHAQFMAFYSTYLCLWMFLRAHHFSARKRSYRAIGLMSLTLIVSYSRVYLFYHTWKQVLLGLFVGTITGFGWFVICVAVRELGILDNILDSAPFRWFYVKDTSHYRSFVRDEYAQWSVGRITYLTYFSSRRYYVLERKLR